MYKHCIHQKTDSKQQTTKYVYELICYYHMVVIIGFQATNHLPSLRNESMGYFYTYSWLYPTSCTVVRASSYAFLSIFSFSFCSRFGFGLGWCGVGGYFISGGFKDGVITFVFPILFYNVSLYLKIQISQQSIHIAADKMIYIFNRILSMSNISFKKLNTNTYQ